jgi:hypothetical protein
MMELKLQIKLHYAWKQPLHADVQLTGLFGLLRLHVQHPRQKFARRQGRATQTQQMPSEWAIYQDELDAEAASPSLDVHKVPASLSRHQFFGKTYMAGETISTQERTERANILTYPQLDDLAGQEEFYLHIAAIAKQQAEEEAQTKGEAKRTVQQAQTRKQQVHPDAQTDKNGVKGASSARTSDHTMDQELLEDIRHATTELSHIQFISMIVKILKQIHFTSWYWYTTVGTTDAMWSAMLTGAVWSFKGTLLGMLSRFSPLERQPQVTVYPHFSRASFVSELHVACELRLWVFVLAAIYYVRVKLNLQSVWKVIAKWQKRILKKKPGLKGSIG